MKNCSARGRIVAIPALVCGLAFWAAQNGFAQAGASRAAGSQGTALKLYVFDCGTLEGDVRRFGLQQNEVVTNKMSVACYLIDHPKGRLLWDVGAVPDAAWTPTGQPIAHKVLLGDGQERTVTMRRDLGAQLKESGYAPDRITHLALSHNHWDHTANANDFKHATWLVRQEERDVMFPSSPPGPLMLPASFSALRASKTTIMKTDEHDVFGDGLVVAKLAPGHTQGHLVLLVRLPKTGPVVLSGDLYHYPEERTLNRLPIIEVDKEQTRKARIDVDAFLKKAGAQLWIQHDFMADAKLKKSPAFYE